MKEEGTHQSLYLAIVSICSVVHLTFSMQKPPIMKSCKADFDVRAVLQFLLTFVIYIKSRKRIT